MPKLIILSPSGDPRTFELEDSATIGRAPEVTIQIDDAVCSRRQCQVIRISSGYELVDLKSRNGTKVNGVKRNRHVLSDGDVIEIGEVRITYREREGSEEEVVLEDFGREGEISTGSDAYLVWSDGDRKGKRIPLSGDRITFGRKDSNTVPLKDAMASSYHCEITREGGGYVLRDLGSTNGTIVNGEAVSEATLGNGARIRIGHTRFVFVDPAVADFEQALAAEEEQEAEWGLMRAQVDMARVKRARRASLVWLLLFVLVVGGGAAVFLTQPDMVKGLLGMQEMVSIREVPGNLVDFDDWSFESPKYEWAVAEGGPGEARIGRGAAHQGSQALLVSGTADDGGTVIARCERDFRVVAGRAYELAGWVRPAGENVSARVGVAWLTGTEGSAERHSFTPFAEGTGWTRVSSVLTAPPRAQLCRIVAAVEGGGSASFDDLVLKRLDEGGEAAVEMKSAGFALVVTPDGGIAIEKAGRFVLWNGGMEARAAGGAVARSPFAFGIGSFTRSGDGVEVAGDLRTAAGAVPVRWSVQPTPDGFRISCAAPEAAPEGVAETGFGFVVSRALLAQGATISGSFGSGEIQADTDQAGVEKAILGGAAERLSLNPAGGARLRMASTPEGLRLALLHPAGEGDAVIDIVADFTSQRQDGRNLLGSARGAKASGKNGEALRLFGRVLTEFPFDEDLRGQAERERDEIVKKGFGELAAARDLYESAKNFYDTKDLEEAARRAEALAGEYEGFPAIRDEAAALGADARTTLSQVASGRDEELAKRLMLRAEDFAARKQMRLARLFWARIDELYPATATAAEARQKLQ